MNLVQLQGLPELANEVNLGRSSEQHSWVDPFRPPLMILLSFPCSRSCLPPSAHACEKPIAKVVAQKLPTGLPKATAKAVATSAETSAETACQTCGLFSPKLVPKVFGSPA